MKYTGDSAVVDILRKGKHMQFEVRISCKGSEPPEAADPAAHLSLSAALILMHHIRPAYAAPCNGASTGKFVSSNGSAVQSSQGFQAASQRRLSAAGCAGAAVEALAPSPPAPGRRGPLLPHHRRCAALCALCSQVGQA